VSERDPINPAALDDLLETTGGDPAFLAELIDTYFQDSGSLLPVMREAVVAGSAEQLRRAAHTLKSNSASFGAQDLTVLCRELEEQGRTGGDEGFPHGSSAFSRERLSRRRTFPSVENLRPEPT